MLLTFRCEHNAAVDLSRMESDCRHCRRTIDANRRLLERHFGRGNKNMMGMLHNLINLAEVVEIKWGRKLLKFLAVRNLSLDSLDGEERALFTIMRDVNPRVVIYGESSQTCFVFNPLKRDQQWSLLEEHGLGIPEEGPESEQDRCSRFLRSTIRFSELISDAEAHESVLQAAARDLSEEEARGVLIGFQRILKRAGSLEKLVKKARGGGKRGKR